MQDSPQPSSSDKLPVGVLCSPDDPLNGSSDRALRRRIQNRTNKRNSRLKKKQSLPPTARPWVIYTAGSAKQDESSRRGSPHEEQPSSQALVPVPVSGIVARQSWFCESEPAERNAFFMQLRQRVIHGVSQQIMRYELLLSVTQYNIVLAGSSNAAALGLTMESLGHGILSPFNTNQPLVRELPPSLQPTQAQRNILHHPWIDICPIPSVRDVLLKRMGEYNEDELCTDFIGGAQGPAGVFVWGEAWDPNAQEFSEHILRKYAWLFCECADVLRSTNFWRARRGEKAISLQTLRSWLTPDAIPERKYICR